MKKIIPIALVIATITLSAFSFSAKKMFEDTPKRNHNVCKKLKGRILLYVIMVETKESAKWDDYDVNSSKDSIYKAVKWIEKQASMNSVAANIEVEYYRNDTSQYIYQNISEPFKKILSKSDGVEEVNKWADKVVKKATGLKSRERLIAKLRDDFSTESVVLLFMVNNYYKTSFSYTLNSTSNEDVEYSMVSSKEPVMIASEILSLFGAEYFYHHQSTSDKKNRDKLKEIFPYDIMAMPDKPINQLYIGEVSKYAIGWTDEINEEYGKILNSTKSKY